MRAVIYSTGSSEGLMKWMKTFSAIPSLNEQWQRVRSHFPDYEFTIVTSEMSAPHLVDFDENKKEIAPEGVRLIVMSRGADADEYVEAIRKEAPSVAMAATYFGGLVDWETIKDALIAEELRKAGIRAVSNSMFAATTFFDKWNTHQVLTEKGFLVAKAVHIPAVYLALGREHPEVASNVFIDLAFHRIRQMRFPVIVKDSAGSGSRGLTVAKDFEAAKTAILSQTETVDLIVEEMLPGEQFGTEIHGTRGHYTILPPFKFRLNEQGITDSKNNIKFGPVTGEQYRIPELRAMLRRLAEEMGIEGCAQVDLAFDGDKWYIIEVNPRLSGMSSATAACESRTPLEVIVESCLEGSISYDVPEILEKCFFFRTQISSMEEVYSLREEVNTKYLEIGSMMAAPGVEIVGATVVLGGFPDYAAMAEKVREFRGKYPGVISDALVAAAEGIARDNP